MARDNLYSKTVAWVKVTLPLIALALLSTLFLLSAPPDPDDALPYAEVDIDEITREQRVTEPRFAGLLADEREIVLLAEAATSETGQTDRIRVQAIEGRLELNADDALTLEAPRGDFDMARQTATLSDGVILRASPGYRLESDRLTMALNRLDLRAPSTIRLTGPGLEVTADSMELAGPEGGAILRFTGSVRVLYDPES